MMLTADNGNAFVGKTLDKWIYGRQIKIDLSCPGKPTGNVKVSNLDSI